jgi:hypothetical protein
LFGWDDLSPVSRLQVFASRMGKIGFQKYRSHLSSTSRTACAI